MPPQLQLLSYFQKGIFKLSLSCLLWLCAYMAPLSVRLFVRKFVLHFLRFGVNALLAADIIGGGHEQARRALQREWCAGVHSLLAPVGA